jgi:hypothetical protein
VDASLFSIEFIWMQEVKTYLEIGQMPKTMNLTLKHKLAKKAEPFPLKEGIRYRMGQNNKICRCSTTSKAQIVLKEWLEDILLQIFLQRKFWM